MVKLSDSTLVGVGRVRPGFRPASGKRAEARLSPWPAARRVFSSSIRFDQELEWFWQYPAGCRDNVDRLSQRREISAELDICVANHGHQPGRLVDLQSSDLMAASSFVATGHLWQGATVLLHQPPISLCSSR